MLVVKLDVSTMRVVGRLDVAAEAEAAREEDSAAREEETDAATEVTEVETAAREVDAASRIVEAPVEAAPRAEEASSWIEEAVAETSSWIDETVADASSWIEEAVAEASSWIDETVADASSKTDEAVAETEATGMMGKVGDTTLPAAEVADSTALDTSSATELVREPMAVWMVGTSKVGAGGATIIGEIVTGPVGMEALEGSARDVMYPFKVTGTRTSGLSSDAGSTW